MCEKLGVEPEFVEINWDTKVVELDQEHRLHLNGMTLTEDIAANTRHHQGLRQERTVVVVKDGTDTPHRRSGGQDRGGRGRFRR